MDEGRRKKEEGRWKKEEVLLPPCNEGRRKKEEGAAAFIILRFLRFYQHYSFIFSSLYSSHAYGDASVKHRRSLH